MTRSVIYGLFSQTAFLGSVMRGPAPFVLQLLKLDWPCEESAFAARTPEEAWSIVDSGSRAASALGAPAYRDNIAMLLSPRVEAEQQLRIAVNDETGSKSTAVLNGLAVIAQ
jgi:hypothetical protein